MTKVSEEILQSIRKTRNEIRLMSARLQESKSKFEVVVSEALMGAGAQIEDSALCLDCGTIRSIVLPQCPTCAGGK